MKLVISRFIAILILVIPGLMAAYGFLAMKDSLFDYFSAHGNDGVMPELAWGKLLLGIVLFLAGVAFIGGWIFFRDRKRNYLQPRFRKKRKKA